MTYGRLVQIENKKAQNVDLAAVVRQYIAGPAAG